MTRLSSGTAFPCSWEATGRQPKVRMLPYPAPKVIFCVQGAIASSVATPSALSTLSAPGGNGHATASGLNCCCAKWTVEPYFAGRISKYKPTLGMVLASGKAMRRRDFIKVIAGPAIGWPLAARAQQAGKLPTIGYLGPNTRSLDSPRLEAFVQRLRELGWIEGRTIAFEYRWAEGHNEHLAETMAEFVKRRVDVIVTSATPPTVAAKQATSVIPIVFAAVGDPVGAGVVESWRDQAVTRPVYPLQATDAAGKRLELLREMVPGLRHLAVMADGGNCLRLTGYA